MGDKISALPAATSVDGTEIIPIVQGGATKKVTGTILRSPTGVAGGDLTGTYPNPTLASITTAQTAVGSGAAIPVLTTDAKGRVVSLTTVVNPALTTSQIAGLSTAAASALATAGVAGLSTFAARADHQHARPTPAEIGALAATATAGGDLAGNYPSPVLAAITTAQVSVGSTSQIPVLSVDNKGRVVSLTSVPIGSSAGGTVTSITAGVGLTGGEITGSGTINIADVTVPQSAGSSTAVPVITINAQGQVTSLTTAQISSAALTTSAPSPLAGSAVVGVSAQAARADHQHVFPSAGQVGAIPLGATAGGDLAGTLPNPTLAAITTAQSSVGSASVVPVISIDAKGRVTSLTTAALSTLGGASLSTNLPSALATTAIAGVSTFAARLDHQHVFPTAAQVGALAATATAGGDLIGNYPNPTLAAITTAQSNVGSSSAIPVISTDAKGRVTSLTTVGFSALTTSQIAGLSTTAPAALATTAIAGVSTFAARADHQHPFPSVGGDLTGTLPNPTLAAITTAQTNVGSSTQIPIISIDEKGRVTSLSSVQSEMFYTVEFLLIAGGGSGGGGGGGGGAGGIISGQFKTIQTQSYPVVIGAGGASVTGTVAGNNGSNSSAFSYTAIGGGTCSAYLASGSVNGTAGGSGGGCGMSVSGTNHVGGSGTSGQGFAGGSNPLSATAGGYVSGGGGGATAVGGGRVSNIQSGAGGAGVLNAINGSSLYWAGGGGGGAQTNGSGATGGAGGIGGGGGGAAGGATGGVLTGGAGGGSALNAGSAGQSSGSNGGNAGTNTGGGGGGNMGAAGSTGSGGSGIFILRYPGAQRGAGGTVTSSGGYTIHTFLTSGTYVA